MCPSERYALPRLSAAAAAAEYRPAFDVLDADRDGKISRDDLRAFYSGLPSRPSEEDLASMIATADDDLNGFVEFDEFSRVLGRRGDGGVLKEVFEAMDRDGDGKVGFGDLKAYLEMAGLPAGDDEIRAMIKMGGGDESEGVGFDQLVKILAFDSPSW